MHFEDNYLKYFSKNSETEQECELKDLLEYHTIPALYQFMCKITTQYFS